MSLADDIHYMGRLLDSYANVYHRFAVAQTKPQGNGVPPDMQAGPVDADGWVQWKVLPSALSTDDVSALENEYHIKFPPLFCAYLLARFHLFDQVKSRKYNQQICMPDIPSGQRLQILKELIKAWQPLITAGYLPFAQWGDGWGPMCFDIQQQASDGECPVIWMDHERIIPLHVGMSKRTDVSPWAQPLYGSCREFIEDIFGSA